MITEILTLEEEKKVEIILNVRGEEWGIQINNHITPLYCCKCEKQLDNFYKLDGGRYGQVGTVICHCGSKIHCVDSDNIVEYLDTTTTFENITIGNYHIDFKQLYRLNNSSWNLFKENIGYDILSEQKNKTINLAELIDDIILKFDFDINISNQYSADKFYKLPIIINKWFELLNFREK